MAESAVVTRSLPRFLQCASLRLILFGGKGGVGKTTCAAAAALHLAHSFPERRHLCVSIDPAHSLQDGFAEPSPLANLDILEIDARECLTQLRQAHAEGLRQIAERGSLLDGDDIASLLDLSIPGLDEIMAFNEISELVRSKTYSCIVVDTAPSGHTLRFLELPQVMRQWLKALNAMLAKHRFMAQLYRGFYCKDSADVFLEDMAARIERVTFLLKDPSQCLFVPVTFAESSCIAETQALMERLEEMRIPVHEILVNQIRPEGEDCEYCRDMWARQRARLAQLCRLFPDNMLWEIPVQGAEVRGVAKLASFWNSVAPVPPFREELPAIAPLPPVVESPAALPGPDVSLIVFAGKGGVGKTTLACATALRLAHEYAGKEILLLSTDPAHSLSECLDRSIGPSEVRISQGLTAMEIDAGAEVKELRRQYGEDVRQFFRSLTGQANMDWEFDREAIEHMLDLSPPGLDEVMSLTRIVDLLEARRYDLFVVDAAATGHLLRLLELPHLVQQWLHFLFGLFLKYKNVFRLPHVSESMVNLSKKVKALESLLTDSRKSLLYAVSIPTEMAFQETLDLVAGCRASGIEVPVLFLNLVTPAVEPATARAVAVPGCEVCSDVRATEAGVRREFQKAFRHAQQPVVLRSGELCGVESLSSLGQVLYRSRT